MVKSNLNVIKGSILLAAALSFVLSIYLWSIFGFRDLKIRACLLASGSTTFACWAGGSEVIRGTLLLLQMFRTMTPPFSFPNDIFTHIPYAHFRGTLHHKNMVPVSAAIVLGATVRGERIVANLENHLGKPEEQRERHHKKKVLWFQARS